MKNLKILICDCSSTEHQIVFIHEPEDKMTYCQIHLTTHNSFLKRLWIGLKYAFGYKSRYGQWDEFILTQKHSDDLIEIANELKL